MPINLFKNIFLLISPILYGYLTGNTLFYFYPEMDEFLVNLYIFPIVALLIYMTLKVLKNEKLSKKISINKNDVLFSFLTILLITFGTYIISNYFMESYYALPGFVESITTLIIFIISPTIIGPIFEEIIFKNFLFDNIDINNQFTKFLSITFVFTILHPIDLKLITVALYQIFSLILYKRTNSLLLCIIIHSLIIIISIYLSQWGRIYSFITVFSN